MLVKGKRIKRTRHIQKGRYVVSIDVEMVGPAEDDSEPCYEAETVQLLREVAQRVEQGNIEWLRARGKVFELVDSR